MLFWSIKGGPPVLSAPLTSGPRRPAHVKSGLRPCLPGPRLPVVVVGGGNASTLGLSVCAGGQVGLLPGGWELSQPLTVGGVGLDSGPKPEPGPGGEGRQGEAQAAQAGAGTSAFSPKGLSRSRLPRPSCRGGRGRGGRARAQLSRGREAGSVRLLLGGLLGAMKQPLVGLVTPHHPTPVGSRALPQCSRCCRNEKVGRKGPPGEGGWQLDAGRGFWDGALIKGAWVPLLLERRDVAQPRGRLRHCCPLQDGGGAAPRAVHGGGAGLDADFFFF